MSKCEVLPKDLDLLPFIGQWVVICDSKVVANDKSLIKLKKDIGQCKHTPTIVKIHENDTWIF